jgi:hypothetical protein
MSEMQQAIDNYRKLGWNIIPVQGKRCLTQWKEYQTVKYNGTFAPTDNIAVVLGAVSGNLVGVDLDLHGKEDKAVLDRVWNFYNQITMSQTTPHGYRLFFTTDLPEKYDFKNGIDVRGEGQYVVLAPSKLEDGEYKTFCDKPPMHIAGNFAEAFAELFDLNVSRQPIDVQHYIDCGVRADEGVSRNYVTCAIASWYKQKGMPEEQALEKILAWNKKNDIPDAERDIRTAVKKTYERDYKYTFKDNPKETCGIDDIQRGVKLNDFLIDAAGGANTKIVWEGFEAFDQEFKFSYVIIAYTLDGRVVQAVVDKKTRTVTIDGAKYKLRNMPARESTLPGQWDFNSAMDWADNPTYKDPQAVYAAIRKVIANFVDVSFLKGFTEAHLTVCALHVMATYFYEVFNSFPEAIWTGKTGSGKSVAMQASGYQSYHCTNLLNNPSPAIVFRIIESLKPTLLLDNIETWSNKDQMGEDDMKIIEMLDVGFNKGGLVMRVEGEDPDTGERLVRNWKVYGPKMVTGVCGFAPSMQTRAHYTTMVRTGNSKFGMQREDLKPNPETEWDTGAAQIRTNREDMYALRFKHYRDIEKLNRTFKLDDCKLVGRDFEVWKPIFVMCSWVCPEQLSSIVAYVENLLTKRVDVYLNEEDEALVRALVDLTASDGAQLSIKDIAERVNIVLNYTGERGQPKPLAGRKIGDMLGKLGFQDKANVGGKGWFVRIDYDMLNRWAGSIGEQAGQPQETITRVKKNLNMRRLLPRSDACCL